MAADEPKTADSNLPASGRDLYDALVAVAHHLLHLITLESQRAALNFSTMVGLMVVVALLVSSAWLLLMFAGVVWLVNQGLNWELALLAGAGLNIILGLLLLFSILQRKVGKLEGRLADERQQAGQRYQDFQTGLRRKMVSPPVLLSGFVAGFVVGRLPGGFRRKAVEPRPSLLAIVLSTGMKTLLPILLASQFGAQQTARQTGREPGGDGPAA